ncbi:MAG: ribonuclease HII [Verrucomicrobia subdivision 3 bacterium]|nr:ribonuclease HII [Limisphaerales bacterium]
MDYFQFEREHHAQGLSRLVGIDEAGRGPLAGPVVAAAVVLPMEWAQTDLPESLAHLNDSKKLTEKTREALFAAIHEETQIHFGIGIIEANVIDEINILQATHRAMNAALTQLSPPAAHALVDGLRVPTLAIPQTAIVKGDQKSFSIAAASILAKVTRDRLMREHDARWPEYNFAKHKGYGTAVHLAALEAHGPCPIHRQSFAPVRAAQEPMPKFQ